MPTTLEIEFFKVIVFRHKMSEEETIEKICHINEGTIPDIIDAILEAKRFKNLLDEKIEELRDNIFDQIASVPLKLTTRTLEGLKEAIENKYNSIIEIQPLKVVYGEDKYGKYIKAEFPDCRMWEDLDIDWNDELLSEQDIRKNQIYEKNGRLYLEIPQKCTKCKKQYDTDSEDE